MTYRGEVGRLNGLHAPAGTILGPDDFGQWFVVTENDEEGCTVAYSTTNDIEAARIRDNPQSVAETRELPEV